MSEATTTKRKRVFFSDAAVFVMKSYIKENLANPYPTRQEMESMAAETGLTFVQVRQWFINFRRRHKIGGKRKRGKGAHKSLSRTLRVRESKKRGGVKSQSPSPAPESAGLSALLALRSPAASPSAHLGAAPAAPAAPDSATPSPSSAALATAMPCAPAPWMAMMNSWMMMQAMNAMQMNAAAAAAATAAATAAANSATVTPTPTAPTSPTATTPAQQPLLAAPMMPLAPSMMMPGMAQLMASQQALAQQMAMLQPQQSS